MDKGLGESRDISETEPPPMQNLEEKIRTYFKIGRIAKNGLEKTSEIYNENFNESLFLKEKTPTLLHKYFANKNNNFVGYNIKEFEEDIKEVAFKYRGLVENRYKKGLPKKIKLGHFEGLDYILKHCNRKELQTRNDVVEALMLAQKMGMSDIIIHRWDRKKMDNKKVGSTTLALFERFYKGNKTEVYNRFKDKLADKFGRTMSKSTFYRYVGEAKKPIKLQIEPDILEFQSNVG